MNGDNEEFSKMILARIDNIEPTKYPIWEYDPDGKCWHFISKSCDYYGKYINNMLTLYLSRDTNEIIGFVLEGIGDFATMDAAKAAILAEHNKPK